MARPTESELRRIFIVWACAAWAWSPLPARADMTDAVNWARLHGCAAPSAAVPLRSDSRLASAASLLAAGQSLQRALSTAGYPAVRSAVVHLSGAVGDAELGRTLAAQECRGLTDPGLREMGVQRRGRDLWLVMAAPAWLPPKRDAASIGGQILGLVNEARAHDRHCGGRAFGVAAPLSANAALSAAALVHAEDMAVHGGFDHQGHDGSTPALRVTRAGFGAYRIVGENIAAGAMSPREVVAGWLASPPHCENIMDPRFTSMGSGFAVNTRSAELVYWTQDFAAPRH
jgi:uncharacterized protein YkwD